MVFFIQPSLTVLPTIGVSILLLLFVPLVLAAVVVLTAMFLLAILDVEHLDLAVEKALQEVIFVLASML